jgi:hypothetical protein
LFLNIAAYSRFHIYHTLLYDSLLLHVDSRGTEGVAEPGAVSIASLVKSVLWEAVFTVFCGGMGFLGFPIGRRAACDIKGTEGVFKALDSLGKAAKGNSVFGITIMEFLL